MRRIPIRPNRIGRARSKRAGSRRSAQAPDREASDGAGADTPVVFPPVLIKSAPPLPLDLPRRTGLFGGAIVSSPEAGRKAAGQSTHHEAIDHLRQGLTLLDRVPDETVRRRLEPKLLAVVIGSVTGEAALWGATQTCGLGASREAPGDQPGRRHRRSSAASC